MSDEEDYNSEEDVDYVPSDGELGSEEEHSGDEEDLTVLADDAGTAASSKKTSRKKQNKNDVAPRKRKGGIKLEDEEAAEETNGDTANTELAQKLKQEGEEKKAEKEKKRTDNLWASFLADVKPPARPSPKTPQTSTSAKQTSSSTSTSSQSTPTTSTTSSTAKPSGGKVTITTVFDFAGEEIKVTKEVDVNSKEAKAELKKQEEEQQEKVGTPSPSVITKAPGASALSPGNSILGAKRPVVGGGGGLGGVLNKIGKKQKMGTLDKSKMDWDSFKKKEGIEEDLKIHNKGKDGYIERMAFLNRADVRQFEIERDLRLTKSSKR